MKTNNDKVIVKLIEEKDVMKGSIYVPSAVQVPLKKGIVIETGPGRLNLDGSRSPCSCQAGDKVMFPAHAGIVINFKKDGEEQVYLVMPDVEILGVLEDGEE